MRGVQLVGFGRLLVVVGQALEQLILIERRTAFWVWEVSCGGGPSIGTIDFD